MVDNKRGKISQLPYLEGIEGGESLLGAADGKGFQVTIDALKEYVGSGGSGGGSSVDLTNVKTNIIPTNNDKQSLGSSEKRWGVLHVGSVQLGTNVDTAIRIGTDLDRVELSAHLRTYSSQGKLSSVMTQDDMSQYALSNDIPKDYATDSELTQAITNLKGGASTGYDTLMKIEAKVKANAQAIANKPSETYTFGAGLEVESGKVSVKIDPLPELQFGSGLYPLHFGKNGGLTIKLGDGLSWNSNGEIVNTRETNIEDNLTSNSATSALSANQGKVLKGLIDSVGTTATNAASTATTALSKANANEASIAALGVNNTTLANKINEVDGVAKQNKTDIATLNNTTKSLQGSINDLNVFKGSALSDLETLMKFYQDTDNDEIINKWQELEKVLGGLTESDNLAEILSGKADKSTVYTRTDVDTMLGSYATTDSLTHAIESQKVWIDQASNIATSAQSSANTANALANQLSEYYDVLYEDVRAVERGLSSKVDNAALSTWKGTANITTLGTITSGTWNGSKIGQSYLDLSGYAKSSDLGSLAKKNSLAVSDIPDLSGTYQTKITSTNKLSSSLVSGLGAASGYGVSQGNFTSSDQNLVVGAAVYAHVTNRLNGYATQSWVEGKKYLTDITSAQVTNALGYTPYNATNPNGYYKSGDSPTFNTITLNGGTLTLGSGITLNDKNLVVAGSISEGGTLLSNKYQPIGNYQPAGDYLTSANIGTAIDNAIANYGFATVATTGSYNDLSNKPTSLPASDVYAWAKATSKPSYSWSEINSKPTFATVATSGKYSDLSGKPTKLSEFTNDSGFTSNTGTVTGVKINGTTKNPSSGIVDLGTVITAHQSLANYVQKGSTPYFAGVNVTSGADLKLMSTTNLTDPGDIIFLDKDESEIARIWIDTDSLGPLGLRTRFGSSDSTKVILHSGNIGNYALPLSGGKMTGPIEYDDYTSLGAHSNGNFYLGNPARPLVIRSNGTHTINGNTLIHSGNIGSQTVAKSNALVNSDGSVVLQGDKFAGSIVHYMWAGGGDASGLMYKTSLGTALGGIGAYAYKDVLEAMYMGWGDSPWLSANSFRVSDTSITYKGYDIIHSNNIGSYNAGGLSSKTPQLAAKTENNEITIVDNADSAITTNKPSYVSSSIRKAIDFRWYGEHWQIGAIRGDGEWTEGFGITEGNNILRFRVKGQNAWIGSNAVIHSGNIGSQSVASATKLKGQSAGGVVDANTLFNDEQSVRYRNAISHESTNIPAANAWQNAILELGLHSNGSTAQLYFSKGASLYYRANVDEAWRKILDDVNLGNYISDGLSFTSNLLSVDTDWLASKFSSRVEGSLPYGKVAQIALPFANAIITLRGTNTSRDMVLYVSSYANGTSLRTSIRILKNNSNYQVYCNGESNSTACIYIYSGYTVSSDSITVTNILGTASLSIIDRVPSDAELVNTNDTVVATLSSTVAAANKLVTSGGVDAVLINSSGNVGIGTTSPQTKLHVAGISRFGTLSSCDIQTARNGVNYIHAGFDTTYTPNASLAFTVGGMGPNLIALHLEKDGNAKFTKALSIGHSLSVERDLTVAGSGKFSDSLTLTSDSVATLYVGGNKFYESDIANNKGYGTLRLGTELYFNVNDGSSWYSASFTLKFSSNFSGLELSTSLAVDGGVTQASDARKKDIIGNTSLTVNEIANAPAVEFCWKNDANRTKNVGTIAQYWQNVLPEVVSNNQDSMFVDYSTLAVVSSIILARNVETHEQRIERLEREITNLQNELDELRKNSE